MNKYLILPLLLAALVLTGQSCVPDAQQQSEALKEIDGQPAAPTRTVTLFTEDGQPVPDNTIRKTHVVGQSKCPDLIGNYIVDLGASLTGAYRLVPKSLPKWLSIRDTGDKKPMTGRGVVLGLEFNCNIADRSTHFEPITAGFALDCTGCDLPVSEGWRHGDMVDLSLVLDLVTQADAAKRK